jgi:hypothetical protein
LPLASFVSASEPVMARGDWMCWNSYVVALSGAQQPFAQSLKQVPYASNVYAPGARHMNDSGPVAVHIVLSEQSFQIVAWNPFARTSM